MSIAENIRFFEEQLAGTGARLVVVTKTHPVERLQEAYEAGARIFGENRVQEMTAKQPELPADVEWHLIGHLQTNKVKYIAPFVHTVQSLDSLKLLEELEKQAAKHNRVIDALLQFHIAEEYTKTGLTLPEAEEMLTSATYQALRHVRITGVMGVATFTQDEAQLRREFQTLRGYFGQLRTRYFAEQPSFREISMGMSSDYALALQEGSTFIRVGSAIFGARG
ncbi:YggS family pyridoxal phosphate-dependent enzyme [Hymenobacter lutimineralis]|uniref:Pyridoxal phosphate homeostasis protein n=1 Tax=Hymenobacter lutimineralis TaxID=2606448 RepID=A0A5D6VGG9_9BACT|nr:MULTISPECIES: YggS family pyridoxal phosphate-dependent enzyme [Hymenobacter]QIX60368.1 YggS family pyridoxal phosphate-dependent enzyme [Hymenobacter sp. BT18]TYZ14212.1 YggS family pyridoxal phosphate-dependent enzyme [Hymenobacter lutimineralis]